MPKLGRSEWYDLARDMNWTFKYASLEDVFPDAQAGNYRDIPFEEWWSWDEPYKITYPEYVTNQSTKDGAVYSVKSAAERAKLIEHLDPGWKSALKAHYGAIAVPEYMASIGESRMGRFGRAAAHRNMAMFGTLDEMRHGQIQLYFPYGFLGQADGAQWDWAAKCFWTNEWGAIAARSLFDDMFTANDAIGTAIQLTFTFETGFTNLQFLGMAADAMDIGDMEFGALISSIQTDESRHAQQGEPTLKVLMKHDKERAQQLIDIMFWRSWKPFALLTGLSMDYYTPLEHRSMSFKEFMHEWIVKQFQDQFRDLGLEAPWYWDIFLDEIDWVHHGYHLGVWYWRPTLWWNPDAGASAAERQWLVEKYPRWQEQWGGYWDVITQNVRSGDLERTFPATLPIICNMCHIPVVRSTRFPESPRPLEVMHKGRKYVFCSDPCKWIFETHPERYEGHHNFVDRFLGGIIQPADLGGALDYMSLMPFHDAGQDATDYAWAQESETGKVATGEVATIAS